ncbi:MAG: hypothetical protein ACRBB0_26870 [Pelagimonas sp.]|uniref:hypothetical protein n=1 Tax=Pelagimonas sp. TaxID=2073170 RepID=UPI003D6A9317
MDVFFQENGHAIATILLASAIPIVLGMGLRNRNMGDGKGIGWSFIRFIVIALALPIVALLGINNRLTGEAATLISGAMGFAFGKAEAK